MIQREPIIGALKERLEKEDYIQAVWEGGAAAFNRVDEWSDIDLAVITDDGRNAEAFNALEEALESVSPIEVKFEVPQPSWHGHLQAFYRLENTSKFLLIDVSVIEESAPDKFLEPEIHGSSKVHFDKTGITTGNNLNADAHDKKLKKRIEDLKTAFGIFSVLMEKEFYRGNYIEAIAFYQGHVLRPLVEALRIKYSPHHYNFYIRYIHYELPEDVVRKLQDMFFIANPDDLIHKQDMASRWFYNIIKDL